MLRKSLGKIGWGLLGLTLLTLVALLSWEPFFALPPGPPPPDKAYSAEIIRDEWGVPHIHGKTDPDVTFGVAYAHAEDDFATLQDVLAMTRGRFGAIAGADGAGIDYAYHLLDARGTAERNYAGLPAEVRALLDGYASGLNRYADTHHGEIKLAKLFPVNGMDIATGFALRQPFFFGLDRTLGPLVSGEPFRTEYGPALGGKPLADFDKGGGDQLPLTRPMPLPVGKDGELSGSNAFAIAPKRSPDGVTRLVSNSHQPWRGGVAWYELEISSDSGWHFAGATFPGAPFPVLGHNENLGWTNTVNRPDITDIFQLVLDKERTHYRLDGKWLALEARRVLLPVKFGPFTLPVFKTIWRTAHGPAVINPRGAFAIRYGGIGQIGNIEQYYRLSKAQDFAGWQAAMALQQIPSTNFIYADRTGNIAYIYNATFPDRRQGPDWRGVVPGDNSALIWDKAIAWNKVPQIINPASGFLFNSNNTPFVAAGPGSELNPSDYPAIMGVETDLTNRTRRSVKLLAATPSIGRAELERIKYDTGYEREGYVKWMLDGIAALDLRNDKDLAPAQALLATWDLNADGKGAADALAVMVLEDAMSASYGLRTPPDPREVLTKSAAHLKQYFGRIDPPLGDVIRIRQGKIDLPMDGGGDTLRAATTWDADPVDGRLAIKHGDSFIMFIEWPKAGPNAGANAGKVRSQSIQPFGAATTRPDSPHYADQAALFAGHKLKPVRFDRADVLAHAVRRKLVTNR